MLFKIRVGRWTFLIKYFIIEILEMSGNGSPYSSKGGPRQLPNLPYPKSTIASTCFETGNFGNTDSKKYFHPLTSVGFFLYKSEENVV